MVQVGWVPIQVLLWTFGGFFGCVPISPLLLLRGILSTLLGVTSRYLLVDPCADPDVRFLCKLTDREERRVGKECRL
mgnify:CR=1 FL=1